jgi:two-component system sensor histidine kinase DegS
MLCEQFGRKRKITAVFRNHGLDVRLQRLLEVSLYRIAQEALSNAAEHSGASSVEVQIILRAQRIRLVIEDNGKGMGAEAKMKPGIGFVSMRERASQFGGTLRVDTSPGEGTIITAEIPLTEVQRS